MESVQKEYAFISKEVKDCWIVRTLLERSERERRQKAEFSSKYQQDEKTPAELVQEKVAEIDRRIELQRKTKPKRLTLLDLPDDTYDYSLNPKPAQPPPPLSMKDLIASSKRQLEKDNKDSANKKSRSPRRGGAGYLSTSTKAISESPSCHVGGGGFFDLDDYLHEDDSQPEWIIKADPVVFEGRRVFAYKSQDLRKTNAKSHIQLLNSINRPLGQLQQQLQQQQQVQQQQQQGQGQGTGPSTNGGGTDLSKYFRKGEPEVLYEGPMISKRHPAPKTPPYRKMMSIPQPISGASGKLGKNKTIVSPYNWTGIDHFAANPNAPAQNPPYVPPHKPPPPYRPYYSDGNRPDFKMKQPGTTTNPTTKTSPGTTGKNDGQLHFFGLGIPPLTQNPIRKRTSKAGETPRTLYGPPYGTLRQQQLNRQLLTEEPPPVPPPPQEDPVVSSILECIGCPKRNQRVLKEVFKEITDDIRGKDPLRIKSLMKNRIIDWPDAVVQWKTEIHKDGTYDRLKKQGVLKRPNNH